MAGRAAGRLEKSASARLSIPVCQWPQAQNNRGYARAHAPCPRTRRIDPCGRPYRQEEDGEGEVQRFNDERVELQEWLLSVEARRVSVSSDGDGGDGDGDGDGGDGDDDESADETGGESAEVEDEADEEDGSSD